MILYPGYATGIGKAAIMLERVYLRLRGREFATSSSQADDSSPECDQDGEQLSEEDMRIADMEYEGDVQPDGEDDRIVVPYDLDDCEPASAGYPPTERVLQQT